MTHITRLLDAAAQGDGIAAEQLRPFFYGATSTQIAESGPCHVGEKRWVRGHHVTKTQQKPGPEERWNNWFIVRTPLWKAEAFIQPDPANVPANPK